MSDHNGKGNIGGEQHYSVTPEESTPTRGTRLYRKPAFRFERVFETMALSCGKTISTQLQCAAIQKAS
jgi:hypothetical protein